MEARVSLCFRVAFALLPDQSFINSISFDIDSIRCPLPQMIMLDNVERQQYVRSRSFSHAARLFHTCDFHMHRLLPNGTRSLIRRINGLLMPTFWLRRRNCDVPVPLSWETAGQHSLTRPPPELKIHIARGVRTLGEPPCTAHVATRETVSLASFMSNDITGAYQ